VPAARVPYDLLILNSPWTSRFYEADSSFPPLRRSIGFTLPGSFLRRLFRLLERAERLAHAPTVSSWMAKRTLARATACTTADPQAGQRSGAAGNLKYFSAAARRLGHTPGTTAFRRAAV